MKIEITEAEAEVLITLKREIRLAGTAPSEFFNFIADRLVHVHKENPNLDYVNKLRDYGRIFYSIQSKLDIQK